MEINIFIIIIIIIIIARLALAVSVGQNVSEMIELWNSHPPRHPSPRTLIPLEHSSPWNSHPPGTLTPPGTPIPLEHPSPPWNTHPPSHFFHVQNVLLQ